MCVALDNTGFSIAWIATLLNASLEGFPIILTYGIELRYGEWQSIQNPVGPLTLIFNALILFPFISVTSRRLQDRGISGWLQLSYITFIGVFVILILLVLPGEEEENKWGRNPLLDI